MNTTIERRSNLELYRILVMLLIIAHHYVVNSNLGQLVFADPFSSPKTLYYLIFGAWGKTGINCFVLITGYFMCRSHFTLRKFLKLLLEVKFYEILFYVIFLCSGYETFRLSRILKLLSPITGLNENFVSCFLAFFLYIPFLNILLSHLSHRQHLLLVCLCVALYSLQPIVPGFWVSYNYVTWFGILYIIAAYLRFYPQPWFDHTAIWAGLTTFSIFLSVTSILAILFIQHKTGRYTGVSPYYFVSDSNQFLALTNGICSFMFFKKLPIPQSKIINVIAATTFGVLLIHANSDAMRQFLWNDLCQNSRFFNSPHFLWHSLGTVLTVFCIASALDYLRIRLFEKHLFVVNLSSH